MTVAELPVRDWRTWLAYPAPALLLASSVLLLLPTLLVGVGYSHSDVYNFVWSSQFSKQVLQGDVYPRWLAGSNDGLGSPLFYFYPPLPFFIAAALNAITFDNLAQVYQVGFATLVLMFASGLAMFAWLREQVDRSWALFGALAYQAGPYHLVDHYVRGAFAEFAAFVFVPLVMLSLRRLVSGRWVHIPLLAPAYAGLLLCHMPVALLATTLAPLYVLYLLACETTDLRARLLYLAKCAAFGILGLGLAAVFVLPAIGLQSILSDQLWLPHLQPARWFLISFNDWDNKLYMGALAAIATGTAVLAIGVLLTARGGESGAERDAKFWAGMALVCYLLMSGLVPYFWEIAIYAKVQFAWRIMAVMEFAALTAAVLLVSRRGFRPLRLLGPAALALIIAGLTPLAYQTVARLVAIASAKGDAVKREWSARLPELDEFLPPGFLTYKSYEGDYWPDRDKDDPRFSAAVRRRLAVLKTRPLADVAGVPLRSAVALPDGSIRLQVQATSPARVVVRRLHFPSWTATSADGRVLPTEPFGPDRLVSFVAPPGNWEYRVAVTLLPLERLGWAVTGGSALLTVIAGLAAVRRRRA